jgi:hypothetical protein
MFLPISCYYKNFLVRCDDFYLNICLKHPLWRQVRIALRVVEGTKRKPGAWRYNWATLPMRDIITEPWFSRLRVGHRVKTLLCKRIIVAKSKEVKTG